MDRMRVKFQESRAHFQGSEERYGFWAGPSKRYFQIGSASKKQLLVYHQLVFPKSLKPRNSGSEKLMQKGFGRLQEEKVMEEGLWHAR